jgi:outer membrane PBP1 activator LpoA protein
MLFVQKRLNIAFITLILITLFISACSTQTTTKNKQIPSKTVTNDVSITKTAEETLALAQSLSVELPNDELLLLKQQSIVNELLIEASELFLQQQNFSKALWLANEITGIFQDNHQNTYRLLLIKANSLLALNYQQEAYQQLQLANELVTYTNNDSTIPSLELTIDYYLILNEVLTAQGKIVLALNAQLNAFALNSQSSSDDILSIWNKLEALAHWQVTQLINSKPPFVKGWAQLINYSHEFGANTEEFSRYLQLWQQHNPTHPATYILSQLQPEYLSEEKPINKIENIAILLPLSGNQKNAGLAAQQGVLAAYKNNTASTIHYIDTNKVDWENMPYHFAELNIDNIIGPLLKPNVEIFLMLCAQHASLQVPTLLLNLPSNLPLADYQTALSMRPEDEAIQAAATLSRQNYNNPIILSHRDRVSKRVALAFSHQWKTSTGNSVDIVYFDQGKQMQATLKESLDVNASQTRIKLLNNRLKNNIKSEPRNRRDIDMIYLVGTAAQTRLIKPYIDVNISPFAEIIPVYASSRSHSNFNDKNNANSKNDLQGLTFTQIPWLLDSKQQNKPLTKLSDKLWPKRTDSLSRIFAMGFDSYNLLGKPYLMKQSPYIRHFGQTGVLKLNKNNILTRSLIWGRYNNDKVTQVALD